MIDGLKLIGASLVILIAVPSLTGSNSTVIEITNQVIQPSVKRLGINLGSATSYDSGQIMKNLLFRNPGFEGEIYQSIIRCVSVTENSCIDENASSAWPAGFWNHATYEFIWGAAKGRKGIVLNSTASADGDGIALQFAESGAIPRPGDYLIVRTAVPGGAQTGWWPATCCGGSITTEFKDLPPNTQGKQALRLVSSKGGNAMIASFFDTTQNRTFVQLHGIYRLGFKAKGAMGANSLTVSVGRNTALKQSKYLSKTLILPAKWKQYSLSFTANETGNSIGSVQVDFVANKADVLLDDVNLEKDDSESANQTAFRDSVVNTLKQLKPGLLRYWAGQLGETLDNQIAPPFGRVRAGFSAWRSEEEAIHFGLNDFLALCSVVGAEPYYVVPTTFSREEMQGLIQFLGAGTTTVYGAKRAALGRADPWTTAFKTIHLEFGNEAWNSIFKGGSIEDATAYGNRAGELFEVARSTPGYSPASFDLVIGGQATYTERNRRILAASKTQDSFSVAPYQMGEVNSYSTDQQLFGPLFAEPQAITSSTGYMGRNNLLARRAPKSSRLAVYEVNVNTVDGSISQAALDSLVPSMGVGLAVIENMLMNLRDLGVRDQMLWVLSQDSFKRNDGKIAKMYGAVIDMGETDRKRPQYLALQLANHVMSGDLVLTRQSGANPTWDQPAMNGVSKIRAHSIQSFAFASGRQRSLILLNLSVNGASDVTFAGENAPRGSVHIERLHAPSITANNETANNVVITEQNLEAFNPVAFSLPPYSMTVMTWQTAR